MTLDFPTATVLGSGLVLPPPPTRDELCGGRCSFQGLTILTRQYGKLPLFDPAIQWLDLQQDRLDAYAVKRAAGDTIVNMALSSQYASPNQAYTHIRGRDFSEDLPTMRARIVEALTLGGMRGVWLMLAGDGEGAGPGYNDPNGWTYGHDWLMSNFARIYAGLADLAPYIVWIPGYDGVVPAWQPWSKVNDWLMRARSIVGPVGHLGLELSAGYWVWSGETNDYLTPAGQCLDLVLYEGPYPMGPPDNPVPPNFTSQPNDVRAPFDQVWQISKRLLGSKYRRPPEQPADDDPGMAPDLPATPRGKLYANGLEFATYGWVRGLPLSTVQRQRDYLQSIGWDLVG